MFLVSNIGEVINLNNIQAITYRKAYSKEYKQGIGTVKRWEKADGYEVIAETDSKQYVIQDAYSTPDAIRIMDEIARDIRNYGGEIVISAPEPADDIPF